MATAVEDRPLSPDTQQLEGDLKAGKLLQFLADVERTELSEQEIQQLLEKHVRENFVVWLSRLIRAG